MPCTRRWSATVASIICCAGCSATKPYEPPHDGALAVGTWGGDSAGFIVGDSAAHLHIACTFGDIDGRIPVSATGDFDVAGRYRLRAFPVAVGPALPARFVGRVHGNRVRVTVTVNDTVMHTTVVRGPVTLQLGTPPVMANCPICRRPDVSR